MIKYDFPEVKVGSVEDAAGPTGVTALLFPAGATCAQDARGGAVASREDWAVHPSNTWGEVDAVVFAGGSTFGLDAAQGVMQRLQREHGGSVAFDDLPCVPAAVVYDFYDRNNAVVPTAALGAKAYDAAVSGQVQTGAFGAGAHVRVGTYFDDRHGEAGGLGAAFVHAGPVKILAVTVVNALGNIYDRSGNIVAGHRDPDGSHRDISAHLLAMLGGEQSRAHPPKGGNTTLAAVVTNIALDRLELQRVAVMAQAALGRVISPLHTPEDGDVVYALSTANKLLPKHLGCVDVGVLAGHALQDAVLRAVGTVVVD